LTCFVDLRCVGPPGGGMGRDRIKQSIAARRHLIRKINERNRNATSSRFGQIVWLPQTVSLAAVPLPSAASSKKKWTEIEHALFLNGVREVGGKRRKWVEISRRFVPSKSPSQIYTHAKKYYQMAKEIVERKRKRKRGDGGEIDALDELHQKGNPNGRIAERETSSSKGAQWTAKEKKALLAGLDTLGWGRWTTIVDEFVPSKDRAQVCQRAWEHHHRHRSRDEVATFAWTEEEERAVVTGMRALGWGKWKILAQEYVPSKTRRQVSSYVWGGRDVARRQGDKAMPKKARAESAGAKGEWTTVWTKAEDRALVAGLDALGWGKWMAIEKHFVPSKDWRQVCQHAWEKHTRHRSLAKWQSSKSWSRKEQSSFTAGLRALGWGKWTSIGREYLPSKSCQQICRYAWSDLHGWRKPAKPHWNEEIEEPAAHDGVFEVEEIVQRKTCKVRGKMVERYLVRWTGYSDEHNTWEPKENVEHILKTYRKARLKSLGA